MEMDLGKLFIGGISWDTREDGLREYFSQFGEVVEAVIMKDRNTGRARGFGFIVFADPAVAERVVMEKHTIDGRMVEAKKAVPRDDQQILNRNTISVPGSPGPGRTKKIFVGGLPSTITESDFKNYFDQFGTITDVVVMYDHNTQRPRGFGFITYDSEDAVDKALVKTFHELNGKIVEVKRAVPKELSPGPSIRSPISGYNYGNRINNFINGYTQGYNPNTISSYGMRMDSGLGPLSSGRNGFTSFGPGIPMGMDYEQTLNSSLAGNSGFSNNLSYGRALLNPFYSANSSRFNSTNTYGGLNANNSSVFSSAARNVLGNTVLNYATNASASSATMASESGGIVSFGSGSLNWGSSSSPISSQFGGNGSGYLGGSPGYGGGDYIGLGGRTFERRISPSNVNHTSASGYEGSYAKLYGSNPVYGDPTWRSALSELDGTGPFGYRLDNSDSDITDKCFADYMTGYNLNNRQPDTGIVTYICFFLFVFRRFKLLARKVL